MKSFLISRSLPGVVCLLCFTLHAQTPPLLSISNDSPTSVQINWENQVGTSYRLWFTPDLTQPGLWTPLEDVFSADTNATVSVSSVNPQTGFFRVEILTNSGVQTVEILSPNDGQIVSGTIAVGVGAQIGAQIMGINLYLDDAPIGYIDSGGAEFDLVTTHFANGAHTLYVSAVDTDNNETPSAPIRLDFENPVRWLDSDPLFQSFVPINVQSDIFPADWTVFVEDADGATVRTFSGTTSDGVIQTNWDGNDQNGVYAPDESTYNITVVVASSGSQSPLVMASSTLPSGPTPVLVSTLTNRYGAVEYMVDELAPDPAALYSSMLNNYWAMPASDRIIFPPFWLLPTNSNPAAIQRRISARQMFMATNCRLTGPTASAQTMSAGGVTPDGAAGATNGFTSVSAWREKPWSSGEIVLARQLLTGSAALFFQGPVAQLLADIQTDVTTAQGDVSGDRETYQGQVLVMQHNGEISAS